MAQQGKLKWYNHVKGYGFLSREEGQKDLFLMYLSSQSRN